VAQLTAKCVKTALFANTTVTEHPTLNAIHPKVDEKLSSGVSLESLIPTPRQVRALMGPEKF